MFITDKFFMFLFNINYYNEIHELGFIILTFPIMFVCMMLDIIISVISFVPLTIYYYLSRRF